MACSDLALLWHLRCAEVNPKLAQCELAVLGQLIADNKFTEVGQLRYAPTLTEWAGSEVLSTEQVAAFQDVLSKLPDHDAKCKRTLSAPPGGAPTKKRDTGRGLPRQELGRLQADLSKPDFDAVEWVEMTRMNQIVGKSAATRASIRSGLRFWEAYVHSLRPGGAFLPPRLEELIAWTSLFRCALSFVRCTQRLAACASVVLSQVWRHADELPWARQDRLSHA